MDGAVLDALTGKHYQLETLENDVVRVESAGSCIRIGIKNRGGQAFSWIEPGYPFQPPPPGYERMRQGEWDVSMLHVSDCEMHLEFEQPGRKHLLALRVTDPSVKPMPVEVTWV